jgi:hypothetical protein
MRSTRILAAAACAAAVAAPLLVAPSASAHPVSAGHYASSGAGRTTVVLNPALVPVLVNTLKVHPIAPGRLSAPAGRAQVSFPITKIEGKVIVHSGGLRFTPVGGGSLRITAFDVDLGSGFLNAKTQLNGKSLPGRVNVFKLGPVQPINGKAPACAGTPAGLTLTPQAAAAPGAPKFTGAFVGDACVVASRRHR